MIQKGDKVVIGANLFETMVRLGFGIPTCSSFQMKYANTIQTAHSVWTDDGHQYVTIDLCVEIPIECCTKME